MIQPGFTRDHACSLFYFIFFMAENGGTLSKYLMEDAIVFMWRSNGEYNHFHVKPLVVLMEKRNTSEIGRYVVEIHVALVFEWISC